MSSTEQQFANANDIDQQYYTKTYNEKYNEIGNTNYYFYNEDSYGANYVDKCTSFSITNKFRKYMQDNMPCEGEWCIDNKWICSIGGKKTNECYHVEHIIDSAEKDICDGCDKNIAGNFIMAYGRWNSQMGNLGQKHNHSIVLNEKRIVYGDEIVNQAIESIKYCNTNNNNNDNNNNNNNDDANNNNNNNDGDNKYSMPKKQYINDSEIGKYVVIDSEILNKSLKFNGGDYDRMFGYMYNYPCDDNLRNEFKDFVAKQINSDKDKILMNFIGRTEVTLKNRVNFKFNYLNYVYGYELDDGSIYKEKILTMKVSNNTKNTCVDIFISCEEGGELYGITYSTSSTYVDLSHSPAKQLVVKCPDIYVPTTYDKNVMINDIYIGCHRGITANIIIGHVRSHSIIVSHQHTRHYSTKYVVPISGIHTTTYALYVNIIKYY